jgi:hypothetical protein
MSASMIANRKDRGSIKENRWSYENAGSAVWFYTVKLG